MPEHTEARHLMTTTVPTVRADATLREALRPMLAASAGPNDLAAVVVVDGDDRYVGLLTPRLAVKGALALWMPDPIDDEHGVDDDGGLTAVLAERLDEPVKAILVHGVPTVAPGDRLVRLIDTIARRRFDALAVVEDGRPVGIVTIARVFEAASDLALTPGDEGIELGGRRRT